MHNILKYVKTTVALSLSPWTQLEIYAFERNLLPLLFTVKMNIEWIISEWIVCDMETHLKWIKLFGTAFYFIWMTFSALWFTAGVIRDVSGSYPLCIHSQSLLIFICIAAWAIEYLVTRRSSNTKQDNTENRDNT